MRKIGKKLENQKNDKKKIWKILERKLQIKKLQENCQLDKMQWISQEKPIGK